MRKVEISRDAALKIEEDLKRALFLVRNALNSMQTLRLASTALTPFTQGWKENQPKEIQLP